MKQTHANWAVTESTLYAAGWTHYAGWVFESPSGTRHDLSAADLTQLDRIEREGLFLYAPDDN
jgi:hypothetical protein